MHTQWVASLGGQAGPVPALPTTVQAPPGFAPPLHTPPMQSGHGATAFAVK